MYALADDVSPAQTNFVHAVRLPWVPTIPQVIDQKHSHIGQGKESFAPTSRPDAAAPSPIQ